MFMKKIALTGALALMPSLMASAAFACDLGGGSVNILSNDFPATQAVTAAAAAKCSGGEVKANLNKDHKDIMVSALTPNPAEYTSVIVANSTLVTLMNDDLVRPLDDLIAKYGQDLQKSQLITVDGKVMAVAFMANAQHLFARQDVLEKIGMDIPATYEDVLAAAEKIKAEGMMDYPVALNTKTGWNLGEEFINMYMGTGAAFFEPGTANVAINNDNGVKTLEMLKALVSYSNPDFLTYDSNATQAAWEAGDIALGVMWGSRGAVILDDEGSTADITSNTTLSAAPSWGGGATPASTLWWDGFTISKNISDEDAEATFKAMIAGISDDVITANNDSAVWLSAAYTPSEASAGVAATAMKGAKPYPMLPFMGTLHSALGGELSDYLQGKESAEQALADIEAAYIAAAKEKGFLK